MYCIPGIVYYVCEYLGVGTAVICCIVLKQCLCLMPYALLPVTGAGLRAMIGLFCVEYFY